MNTNPATSNKLIRLSRPPKRKLASPKPGGSPANRDWRRAAGGAYCARVLWLVATLFFLLATNALAALIAYEPYNYTLASAPTFVSGSPTQTTGGGFSSGYNGGGLTTVAGLTYAGLGANYNALKQTAAYSGENLASPVSSGTVYLSYLINMSGNPGGNKVGLEMNTGGNGMFVGVTTPVTGTTGKLGVNQQVGYNDGAANQWESPTANITYGNTYFVVVKLTGTGSGWTGSIWVNPTANTGSEPAADGTFTMPQFTISACSIVNPAGAGGNFVFDELRIGTTWAEAVTYSVAPPAAPTGLGATPGGNSVSLSWTAAVGSPVSYNVKRSSSSGSGYVTVSAPGAVTGTAFSDTVVGGSTYYYVVSAVNAGGESANSSEVSAAPTLVAPVAPTGLAANGSDGQVVLNWAAAIAATGYNVKRSTTSGAEVAIATTGGTSYTDLSVANGTVYYYKVSATNSVGEGANSAEVTAAPVAYVPVYERFNYSLGSFPTATPNTGSGLTGNWTVGNGTIVSGLTYANLPTGNNAISTTGSRNQVSLTSPLSTGTKYVSFLFNQLGNNGGNLNGLVLFGNGATSLIVGLTAPFSGTAGSLGLGSVTTAGTGATGISTFSGLQVTGGFNYNQTHLVVVKIDFNTAGANDTVSVWLDPVAGTNAPGSAANLVWTNYDVGTITGVGFNTQGGGFADVYDEIRTGATYGSVVGVVTAVPTIPTTVTISASTGKLVSWAAYSTNSYQPQESSDNSTWTDLGGLIVGSAVTSVYDATPANYYRVLELVPGGAGPDVILNGSFEIPDGNNAGTANWNSPANSAYENVWVTNSYGALSPVNGTNLLYLEGTTAAETPAPPNAYLESDAIPVTAGLAYRVKFSSANPVMVGGANPQYRIGFYDAGDAFISGAFTSIGAGANWQVVSVTNTAPANAVSMRLYFIQAVGAGASWDWVTLIDDVTVNAVATPGPTNALSPVVQPGSSFTATVQTNGITAVEATGTIKFLTNSVQLSVNSVTSGSATSANALLTPPYTVTAIYSGDGNYLGSTNSLTVTSSVNATPTNIVSSIAGNLLTLSWPEDHTGWKLQAQTNALNAGLTGTWYEVAGSAATNQVTVPMDPANPTVFFRLMYP